MNNEPIYDGEEAWAEMYRDRAIKQAMVENPYPIFLRQICEKREAMELLAIDALARYQFKDFGFFAERWVEFNEMLPRQLRITNVFETLVVQAREMS